MHTSHIEQSADQKALRVQPRTAWLTVFLGATSFAAPHFALLLVTGTQTFLQRESTLWLTCALLLASGAFAGFTWPGRLRPAIAIMGGAVVGVIVYVLSTVDVGGPQFYGAISPKFLWVVVVTTSFLLMLAPVVLGIFIGSIVRSQVKRQRRVN